MNYPIEVILLFICLVILYFLPSIKARNNNNFTSVLLFNVFLGWTVFGWLFAYILSTENK